MVTADNLFFLALGSLLLLSAIIDILWTTLWANVGAGPLSTRLITGVWRGLLLAVLILLLRRPPVIVGLSRWFRPLQTRKEMVFTAWFGPIGISTLFYAMLAERQTGLDSIWPVASLLLCASLVAHGLSATPFSRRMEGGREGDSEAWKEGENDDG